VILFILLLMTGFAHADMTHPTMSYKDLVTVSDYKRHTHFRVVRSCVAVAPTRPGAYIEYLEPSLFIETVKKPGDYVVRESGKALQGLVSLGNKDKTSTSSSQSMNGSNLQFNEVHIYDLVQKLGERAVMCGTGGSVPDATTGIRFLSEHNADYWREGQKGFLIHWSSIVASKTTTIRGLHKLFPIGFDPFKRDRLQLVYPYKRSPLPLDWDVSKWQISRDGRYVWVYWRHIECCHPLPI
jgi:hypothetical protein